MYKFILSTDSTCDLYADFVRENDIRFVSLNFVFEENGQFTEGVDAFTEYSQYVDFYNRLRGGAFSRTSMLNYESHYNHFKKMAEEELQKYLNELEKKGVQISENDVKIYTGSETYYAKGTLKIRCSVGRKMPSVPIPIENSSEEETKNGD